MSTRQRGRRGDITALVLLAAALAAVTAGWLPVAGFFAGCLFWDRAVPAMRAEVAKAVRPKRKRRR